MEEKKRTLLAILISVTILAAVVYSFGLNFFRSTPEIVVADPSVSEEVSPGTEPWEGPDTISVEVTPETVQSIIASMARYKSYSRTVEITYAWGEGQSASITAQVREDNGWVRCDTVLVSGITEHSILGDGSLWYWYDEGPEYLQVPAGGTSSDLIQYVPTYEDVLKAEAGDITYTSYEEKSGVPCICVEVSRKAEAAVDRYWVSTASGLLIAAETEENGLTVYTMSSGDVVSPAALDGEDFTLPDGTVLR